MKRHFFGAVGSLTALLLVAGCASDPTANLRGDIASVLISRTYFELDVGETIRLNAKAYDSQGNVVGTLPTISVDDESVATVTIDTLTSGDPLPETDFVITAVAGGSVVVTATAGGVSSTADGIIFPPLTDSQYWPTFTLDATGAVDMITVTASDLIKFDAASSAVLSNGVAAVTLSRTEEQITVAVISAAPLTDAAVSVSNLQFVPPYGAVYPWGTVELAQTVDIRTTLFDGAVTVDHSKQADYITLSASASFEFASNATVVVNGAPTFIVSRSATELVVAGSNIDAVTGGTVTVRHALLQGEFDVASIVTANTVDLEAFDNSVFTNDIATAPDVSGGPFPLVVWGLVTVPRAAGNQYVRFSPAADLALSSSVDWVQSGTDIDVIYTDAAGDDIDCLGCGSSNPETGSWTVTGGDTNYVYVQLWSGNPTVFRATITRR